MFDDPELDALVAQVVISNQNVNEAIRMVWNFSTLDQSEQTHEKS